MRKVMLFCSLLFCLTWPVQALPEINAMAPLIVRERSEFQHQLKVAKKLGITAISVDVWWGLVEQAGDQQFVWHYYDDVFSDIRAAGLKIIPIMAFHQCGGNVGDDCDIPLPGWIWTHYQRKGIAPDDLRYQSEDGNTANETLSLWSDELVKTQYIEFMQAFATRYQTIATDFVELNISMGPAGELRYPSYNSHDGVAAAFPSRGRFQAYSLLSRTDFQLWLEQRYQSIATLNSGWGTAYKNFAEIALPLSWDQAIASNQHLTEPSRQDFLQWYHQALVAHGARMLRYAEYAFQQLPAEIPLGFKIPGIHWTINSDIGARTAELAAGIIDANAAFSSTPEPGYQQIIALAAPKAKQPRKVVVHFTALEMSDKPEGEAGSMPSTLVNWIGAEARRQGVILKGENALAAGLYHAEGWSNLQQVLRNGNYQGLTLLRLNDIVENPLAVATLQQLQPGF